MRKFKGLMEASDTIVFAYGRFNPPTTGHEKLIQKVASVSGSNPFRIYPSHSQNPKKDPLPQALKTAYMRKMFKKYARNIIVTKSKNAIEIAVELYDEGYKNLIMVAGSDRVKVFDAMLNNYNGVEGKKHGYYKFDSIKIISAGERDPDSEGVEGMSASKMRAAASNGDMDLFLQGVPSGFSDGKKLYRDVRKYMGVREERDMGNMTDFETLRDAYLTGKVWNVGDVVEANGVVGEIVRKGTNYLSFVAEDGKVHKAWLHEILVEEITKKDLDQVEKYADRIFAKVGIDVEFTRHFLDRANDARNKKDITTSELTRLFKQSYAKFGKKIAQLGPDAEAVINDMKTDVNMPFVLNLKGQELELVAKTVMRKKDFKTSGPKLSFESLDERNYAKEYANYQGTPEQIARRSSRNKARRIMGDKTKIGMDVGHKDNDPMNNDPTNLRNEDPSKNRREPRLRGKELDEVWWDKVIAKLNQMTHPKEYGKMVQDYAELMKQKKYHEHPSKAASEVAREYRGVDVRGFIKYINTLVAKKILPQELKAEYIKEEWSFKNFVNQIQERKLTDTELKRREEIAKDLSDDNFKKKYGDRWKEVKMGVATKMAKNEQDDPCWDGYKQIGMKKKDGKKVPNCVPEEFNEWNEIEEASEYQGKKVTLNKPFYTPDGPKKSAVYVTGPKDKVVIVRFGDPNMEIKRDDPERRKSFRARHGCDNPGPKWKAKYWSCKAW